MAATEPIRDKNQLKALGEYFLKQGQLRNYALVVVGAHTVLRRSDLLRLSLYRVFGAVSTKAKGRVVLT